MHWVTELGVADIFTIVKNCYTDIVWKPQILYQIIHRAFHFDKSEQYSIMDHLRTLV